MPFYQFQAKDRDGHLYRDRLEAGDLRHAHRLLAARHWFVVGITEEGAAPEARPPAAAKSAAHHIFFAPRARRKQVPIKTEQMAQLLRAGMRLSETLETMGKRSADPAWRAVFDDLRSKVIGGKPLSEAMATHPKLFDPLFRAMVATGETSGHLVEVLDRLAQHLQRRAVVQQQVIDALIYPVVIIGAGFLTIAFFMIVMLPKLGGMFKEMGQALPWSTQTLILLSDLMVRFGWLIPVALAAAWLLFRNWIRDSRNRLAWDRWLLRWPLVGRLLALSEHSRFAQTLATLLHSGVTLVDSLQVAEATLANTALRAAVRAARTEVREGQSLHDGLASGGMFPDMMLDMLMVAERTGDLAGSLRHTAQAYERDLDRAVRTYTSLIEPALITVMAAFVGSIVYSILSAVFELTSGIGRM